MFKNTYQSGFLSILYSIGSKPLQIWEKESNFQIIKFIMGILNDSQIKTYNHQFLKLWAPMLQQPLSPVHRILTKLWESNSLFLS